MSYGEVYIKADLDKGMSVEKVSTILHMYYNDIPLARARLLVQHIKKHGIDVPNPYWKSPKQTTPIEKKLNKIMYK